MNASMAEKFCKQNGARFLHRFFSKISEKIQFRLPLPKTQEDDQKLFDFSYNGYGIWIDAVQRTSGLFFSKTSERLHHTGGSQDTVDTVDREVYVATMTETQYTRGEVNGTFGQVNQMCWYEFDQRSEAKIESDKTMVFFLCLRDCDPGKKVKAETFLSFNNCLEL